MKKTLIAALALTAYINATAQETNAQPTYRRSSLYTIMIPSTKLTGDAKEIVTQTFDTLAIPDKYNDHNLEIRTLDLNAINVTQEEIDAVAKAGNANKSGFGKFMRAAKNVAAGKTNSTDDERVAKILKFFKDNHIANKLIGKWYNEKTSPNADGTFFDYSLIADRGLQSASEEEKNMAKLTVTGNSAIMDAAADELIPNTFVMVTYYGYLSADEIIDYISAAAGGVGGGYAAIGTQALKAVLKGYFVTTWSYLFQLEWDEAARKDFESKYYSAKDTKEFDESDAYKLKYIGKTMDYAPATMQFTTKDDASTRLISRATVRATDGSIAKLQKKYDVFKTLSAVHVNGDEIYAYIGKKEGLKKGDKFDVLELSIDQKTGKTIYNKVASIKVAKGKIWDNRAGAGEKIEGAAESKEDGDIDQAAKYTVFDGNAGKIMEGMFIRQTK